MSGSGMLNISQLSTKYNIKKNGGRGCLRDFETGE
jgi:hypothetical protein